MTVTVVRRYTVNAIYLEKPVCIKNSAFLHLGQFDAFALCEPLGVRS